MSRQTNILDEQLQKYVDGKIIVKFQGGRQVEGTLKGYDLMANLVLDEAVETLRDAEDPYRLTENTRRLGLVVCRYVPARAPFPKRGQSANRSTAPPLPAPPLDACFPGRAEGRR